MTLLDSTTPGCRHSLKHSRRNVVRKNSAIYISPDMLHSTSLFNWHSQYFFTHGEL